MVVRKPGRLTNKELNERLKSAKDYIANKERVKFIHSVSFIDLLEYNPNDVSAFLCKEKLNLKLLEEELLTVIRIYPSLYALDSPLGDRSSPDPFTYSKDKEQSKNIGLLVPMLFYPYASGVITKHAICWVGTWHHAPCIAWCARNTFQIKSERLPSYSDLL